MNFVMSPGSSPSRMPCSGIQPPLRNGAVATALADRIAHLDARDVAAAEAVAQRRHVEVLAGAEPRLAVGVEVAAAPLLEEEVLRLADNEEFRARLAQRERHERAADAEF